MSRKKTKNTLHSYDRAAERAGLSRGEAKRLIKMASGLHQNLEVELPDGPVKDFLLKKAKAGKRIKYLEGYVFVFCKTSTKCLTMYKIYPEVLEAQKEYDEGRARDIDRDGNDQ